MEVPEKVIAKMYDMNLFKEMLDWSMKHKAEIVFWKCVFSNHVIIARKIRAKYGPFNGSDLIVAMNHALIANKKAKE